MAKHLKERGVDVVVISPADGELYERSRADDIKTVSIEWRKRNYFNPFFLFALWKKLRNEKLDAIVFNSFIDVRDGALISRLAGVNKRILRVGMPIVPRKKFSYLLAFNLGISHFVAISKEIFNLFTNSIYINSQTKKIIPNGIDLDEFDFFKVREYSFSKKIVFGNCVRLSEQKGLFDFIDIAANISYLFGNCEFLLAGKGEQEKELREYAAKKGMSDKIKFLGHVESVSHFYQKIDCLVFTSRYEGTARTIIESMSSGSIVFCYDTSSMAEMINHGVDGFKVPPFSTEKFTEIIIHSFENQLNMSAVAMNARKKVEISYSKKINFEQWEKLILLN